MLNLNRLRLATVAVSALAVLTTVACGQQEQLESPFASVIPRCADLPDIGHDQRDANLEPTTPIPGKTPLPSILDGGNRTCEGKGYTLKMSVRRYSDESEAMRFMGQSDVLADCEDGYLHCDELAASEQLRGTLDDIRVFSLVDYPFKIEEMDEGKDGAASRILYFRQGAVAGYVEFTDEHPAVVREEGELVDVLPISPDEVALAEDILVSIRDRLDEVR